MRNTLAEGSQALESLDLGTVEEADALVRPLFARPRLWSWRNIVATALVGLAVAALVWFFNRPGGLSFRTVTLTAAATGPAPKVGSPAPDFTVKLLDGQTVELADYQGEVVWINFWATWCPPCRAEMPDIQEVFETYRDQGLRVIALSIGEQRSDVQGYVDRTGLGFDIGLDSDTAIAARYRVVGIPTHYFVDRDGTLREIRIGALNKKGMEERVRKLLEGVAP